MLSIEVMCRRLQRLVFRLLSRLRAYSVAAPEQQPAGAAEEQQGEGSPCTASREQALASGQQPEGLPCAASREQALASGQQPWADGHAPSFGQPWEDGQAASAAQPCVEAHPAVLPQVSAAASLFADEQLPKRLHTESPAMRLVSTERATTAPPSTRTPINSRIFKLFRPPDGAGCSV